MRAVLSHSFKKISVLFGGRPWALPICLAALALMLWAVRSAVTAESRDSVSMALVDECGGELSSALCSELRNTEGFTVLDAISRDEAEEALLSSKAEAMLVILQGYDEVLSSGRTDGAVEIITVPGSVTAELIRETVAGKLLMQLSRVNVLSALTKEGVDVSHFDEYAAEFKGPGIYRIESLNGPGADRAVFGQGFPGYEGFAALALMLLMLTLARRFSGYDHRLVSGRMLVQKHGRLKGFLSDALALLLISLLLAAAVFALAPKRDAYLCLGLFAYCLNLTGLCTLISRRLRSGRIDMASPVIALVTGLLGGCFMDVGSLSPALAVISKFTPQGQLIAASQGDPLFALLLASEAVAMLAGGF